jgi:hypothetical protein
MNNHTPGPWKIEPSWHDWVVVGPNGEEIIFQDGPYQTPTIRAPDAHLIAAAPELLEALQESLRYFTCTSVRGMAHIEKCERLIAKATQGGVL